MTSRCFAFLAAVLAAAARPTDLSAQIRASERGTVSQTIDGTTITMNYARPQVRGRDSVFGGVVPWGAVWTGANWATTLETDKNITLNGHSVAAGRYSVWFEIQPETWTVILDPEPERFHLLPPPKSDQQLRFSVKPESGPHVEVLTWAFPEVRPTGGTLRFAWGATAASLAIGVEPSQTFTVTPEFAERFVGTYRLETRGLLGEATVRFDVGYQHGRLTARWENPPNPHLADLWLAPRGAGMFFPVELEKGELWDVVTDIVLEFTPLEGRAGRFEMRGLGDELWGTGIRTN